MGSQALEQTPEGIAFANALSRVIGWTYFICWSISFYPQIFLNIRRRSVQGLAIDFPILNTLGFAVYTTSSAAFLWSPTVRAQYAARNPASPEPTVRFNDFAFAFHALIMCIITCSQFFPAIWGFSVGRQQRPSRVVLGVIAGCLLSLVIVILRVASQGKQTGQDRHSWQWIEVVYTLSYVKLVCTVVKYCPQAWVNYKRKSTIGWSIHNILLDFSGSILSFIQLFIDSALQADWSGLTGNPVKLGLSNIGIFFDLVFMTQHYILYQSDSPAGAEDGGRIGRQGTEEEALL